MRSLRARSRLVGSRLNIGMDAEILENIRIGLSTDFFEHHTLTRRAARIPQLQSAAFGLALILGEADTLECPTQLGAGLLSNMNPGEAAVEILTMLGQMLDRCILRSCDRSVVQNLEIHIRPPSSSLRQEPPAD